MLLLPSKRFLTRHAYSLHDSQEYKWLSGGKDLFCARCGVFFLLFGCVRLLTPSHSGKAHGGPSIPHFYNFASFGEQDRLFTTKPKPKGYFLFARLCPVVVKTWCPLKSEFFLCSKIRISNQKSGFDQGLVCSSRHDGRFGTFGSIFRLFVSQIQPFS